ncbi:glycosyltransferase [Elusimicrobiota bacterium]
MIKTKKKVTIIAMGSRGDVQPYVALGSGLMQAGFSVCIATHRIFKEFVEEYGLEFAAVFPDDPRDFLLKSPGKMFLSGNPVISFIGSILFFGSFNTNLETMMDDCLNACVGSDAVLNTIVSPGLSIPEVLKIPCFVVGLWPASPTRQYPHPTMPYEFRGFFNLMGHKSAEYMMWVLFHSKTNKWRRSNKLNPISLSNGMFGYVRRKRYPWIFGYSPSILPRATDWPDTVNVTGYWFLSEHQRWNPPEYITEFLSKGAPPVYIGFGSMVYDDTSRLTSVVINALKRSGQRGILSSGWTGLGNAELPENIIKVDYVPHNWLFKKVSSVIYHGGSGTTAAVLKAGVPSLVVPFLADQYFWGRTVHRIGAALKPMPKRCLNEDNLTQAIDKLSLDDEIRENAVIISDKIKKENGIANAVDIIVKYLN